MSGAEPPDGPIDPPRTPESPATDAGSPESEAPAPFLPAESTPPAPSPRRPHRGGAWPIWAAGALVAATLLAVFSLLHPRHAVPPSGEEGVPATVTAEDLVLQREPSARSAAIATLPQGQRVRVRAETPPWLEVAPRSSMPTCTIRERAGDPAVRRLIDFSQPAGLLLVMVLHFIDDAA